MGKPLTDEQIENWRKCLRLTLGAYALIMPIEEIQQLHDKMQAKIDAALCKPEGGE